MGTHRPPRVPGLDLIWNQRRLRQVLTEYLAHYNRVRPHRGLDLRPPDPSRPVTVNGPAGEFGDTVLDPDQPGRIEAGRQPCRCGRGRGRHRREGLTDQVIAAAVQADQEVPAEHLGLRQRQQQSARGQATIPLLDRTHPVVERGDHPKPIGQLSDRDHPRHRRQRRVRSADTNPASQPTYALYRTGALLQQMT